VHFFMRSAQRWVQPAAGASCYDTEPPDFAALIPAWRAMWPEFFPRQE
jgi:hypothetical protein